MTRTVLFLGLAVVVFVISLGLVALGLSSSAPTEFAAADRGVTGASHHGVAAGGPVADVTSVQGYGALPLYFEPNQGQTDPSVEFLARAGGYTLYLTSSEAVLAPNVGGGAESSGSGRPGPMRIRFLGASLTPVVAGAELLPGHSNYLLPCAAGPQTEIPHFAKVRYELVYPGIDLVFYGNARSLEFDFVVAPTADPGLIRLGFGGAESLALDGDGNLVVEMDGGAFIQHAPTIYQEIDGVRRQVSGGYELDDSGDLGFDLGPYDAAHTLVIDPMLSYSTYLGSDSSDTPHGIAVDSAGYAYITGEVNIASFPTTGPTIGIAGGAMVLVAKLNATGNDLVYSTFVGGCTHDDIGHGIAVDVEGNAYVAGTTRSVDFPTENSFQDTGGVGFINDGFLFKLNTAGTALIYSTYLGGAGTDVIIDVAVDSDSNAYVTGSTTSSNFPTWNAYQDDFAGGSEDTFVTKFSVIGSVMFSTYLSGTAWDRAYDIAVDAAHHCYVTGLTMSTDFPTLSSFQGEKALNGSDAYVTKFSAGGGLLYSTYLGGVFPERGHAIAVDSGQNAYVVGQTESSSFPTVNAFDGTLVDTCANFVSKLNSAGNGLIYSTYLGDVGACPLNTDVAVDPLGRAHVVGWTGSSIFPTVNPIQGSINNFEDGFVSRFSSGGQTLEFSSYLGGSGYDDCRNVALDPSGNIYVLGYTPSSDFPTVNAFQPDRKTGGDLFVVKIADPLDFFIAAAPRLQPGAEAVVEELLSREQ